MRGTRSRVGLAIAAAMSLAACGGAATPQAPQTSAATKQKVAALELVKGAPKHAQEMASENDDGTPKPAGVAFPQVPSFDRMGMPHAGRPRATVKTEPFRIADLPRADIPEPLAPSQAPLVTPAGEQATDLFVDWDSAYRSNSMIGRSESTYTSVRVSLRGHNLARLRVGNNEGAVTAGAGGGVYVVCRVAEDSVRRFVTARWESLGPSNDGGAVLSVIDAWFDMHTCKATIVRKTRVALKALASGIFFGYREACKDCPTGERVVFVSANPQHIAAAGVGGEATTTLGAVSRVILPVRKGGGGSVVVRYSSGVLTDWLATLGQDPLAAGDVVAGIDIAQGVEDAEPIAVAYATKTPAPLASALHPSQHDFLNPRNPAELNALPVPQRPKIKMPPKRKSPPPSSVVDPFGFR